MKIMRSPEKTYCYCNHCEEFFDAKLLVRTKIAKGPAYCPNFKTCGAMAPWDVWDAGEIEGQMRVLETFEDYMAAGYWFEECKDAKDEAEAEALSHEIIGYPE